MCRYFYNGGFVLFVNGIFVIRLRVPTRKDDGGLSEKG